MRLSAAAKRMIRVVCISFPILVVGSAVYYRSLACAPFVLGLLLGTFLNITKIWMLNRTTKKVLGMEVLRAGNYVRVQHFLRFFLTCIVLVIAALAPFVDLWGAIAGVVVYQIAVYTLKGSWGMGQGN